MWICTRVLLLLPPGVNLIAAINYLVSLAGRINFTDSYTPSKADRILCMQIEKVYLMVNSQKSKYAHNLLETMFGRNQFGDRMLWIIEMVVKLTELFQLWFFGFLVLGLDHWAINKRNLNSNVEKKKNWLKSEKN